VTPSPSQRTRCLTSGLAVTAITLSGLLSAAAAGHAAVPAKHKPVSFGAKLSSQSQPSNAFGGQSCQPEAVACTRVMTEAYRRSNPDTAMIAPKTGRIGKIEIVAGVSGAFRLQIVRVKLAAQKAKLVRNGPAIHYDGQGTGEEDNGPPYSIETFKVNVPVHKGDYLAVKSKKISFEYCSGGSNGQITFEPPLVKSSSYRHTKRRDDCLMLLEAVYK
jgi:hypothetical protein